MSEDIGFLITAGLIVLLFGLKLLFGGVRIKEAPGTSSVTQRFVQGMGWDVQPGLVLLAVLLLSVLVLMVFLEIFPQTLMIPLLASLAFAITCLGLIRDVVHWRARRFENKLIDAVDMMIPSLRMGNNTLQSLTAMTRSSDGLVKREFSDLVQRIEIGLELKGAMSRIKDLYDSEGVRLFCMALLAKSRHGGDLAMTLTAINETMRERLKMRLQMTGQLSGVRLAAFILAAAPYVLYSFFLWVQPGWVSAIHNHELGVKLLYGAMLIQVMGMAWLVLILDSES